MMATPSIQRRDALLAALGAAAGLNAGAPAAAQGSGAAVHALLVGIDNYRLEPLRGCVNDLRLLERSIRTRATSVTLLVDREGTRANFLRAWREATARCQRGDWFFFSFSGHGARKPEAIPGSEADGMDDFLVFWPFHPVEAPGEIMLDNDLEVMFAELGMRGVTVVFVADCCHAGTMTRGVHPAAERQVRLRTLDGAFSVNALVASLASAPPPPRSPPPDALRHVHLFAGSVESLPVPEVTFEGRRHGALSVVFARALAQGSSPSLRDLADQVVRGVRAMGDGRQNAEVTLGENGTQPLFSRGVPAASAPAAAPPPTADTAVRLRLDGRVPDEVRLVVERLPGVQRVDARDDADLLWNPGNRQLVSGLGDLLAEEVDAGRIATSVARFRAVRRLQSLAMEQPPELRIERVDRSTRGLARTAVLQFHNAAHPAGAILRLTVDRLRHPFFVLLSLAGDGTMQFLYPGTEEPPRIDTSRPFIIDDIIVKRPFGADHVVAVAMDRPTTALVRDLNALHERPEPLAAVAALERALTGGRWQVGLLGIFTRPA
jgi:hypothetical protein